MGPLDDLASRFGKMFLRMHRLFDRRMAESGASSAKLKFLMYLEKEGPSRATDIADLLGLAPRTVTEGLDGLERDGLIRRDPDPADRRAKRVSLTPAGRDAIAATEPVRRLLVDRVFGVLSASDCQALDRILTCLSEAIAREEA
jgi:DNA-binding MarR family transcriptional regulator